MEWIGSIGGYIKQNEIRQWRFHPGARAVCQGATRVDAGWSHRHVQVDAYLTCCLRESSQCLCRLSTVCCSHWTVETKNGQPLETMSRPFDVHVRDLDMGHFNLVLGGQKLVRLQIACVCICIKQL